MGREDEQLFTALGNVAENHMENFNSQDLANTSWAFATVRRKDKQLFTALSDAAQRRMKDFNSQGLTNTAWALTDNSACAVGSC